MAIVGTGFLGLRMAALLLGLGHHGDGAVDFHAGAEAAHGGAHGHADGHAHGADDHSSLALFTTQGLAAFLMGTGWLGVSLHGRLPVLAVLALSSTFGA